jgi:hypothetical protein
MRKLVIILAVFVLLFVAVLIWGVARDRDPPGPGEAVADNCNGPPRKANGDIDTDLMDKWKENCTPTGAEKSANRFTKGTLLSPAAISLKAKGPTESRSLDSIDDKDKIRMVKLAWVSGGPIEVTAEIDGEDEPQQICLSGPDKAQLSDQDNNRICRDANRSPDFPKNSATGVFAVGQGGANFTFKSLVKAEARSTK